MPNQSMADIFAGGEVRRLCARSLRACNIARRALPARFARKTRRLDATSQFRSTFRSFLLNEPRSAGRKRTAQGARISALESLTP
jgi:hypothetical protein